MFYAYVYRTEGVPFYVGKGTGNRAFIHLKSRKTSHFVNRVKNLVREGKTPDIEIIEAIDEEHAKFLEICLIRIFGRADLGRGTLMNLTDGGDGRSTWSEEQKVAHSLKITGQKRTIETRQRMKASAKGNVENFKGLGGQKKGAKFSESHKRKLATAQTGKKHSEETKKKIAETRKATNARNCSIDKVTKFVCTNLPQSL